MTGSALGRSHERCGVRARSSRLVADGARSMSRLHGIRDRVCGSDPEEVPPHPAPRFGLPLARAVARARFQRCTRARRDREHVCHRAAGQAAAGAQPTETYALSSLGSPTSSRPATSCTFCNAHQPIALEGIDSSMFTYMHDKGMSTSGRAMLPAGNAWLVVEFGARVEARRRRARASANGSVSSAAASADHEAGRRSA